MMKVLNAGGGGRGREEEEEEEEEEGGRKWQLAFPSPHLCPALSNSSHYSTRLQRHAVVPFHRCQD
jgi:hypothetical protein